MKKFVSLAVTVCVLLLMLLPFASALDIPKPTADFFVNDFANVISESDRRTMQNQGEKLYKACKAQVVVATVSTLGGSDLETYSLKMAREWGIGDKESNSGVLLLLAVSERKVRIEVGYGLEGALPDSKTGRILDTYGMDYFKVNEFSEGLAAVYNSLVNEVYIEYGMEPDNDYEPVDDYDLISEKAENVITVVILVIFILLTLFRVVLFRFFPGLRRRGRKYRGGFFGGGFGGGSFGGGSSGGFSGGGGSFGGGGSSRGF